MNKSKELINTIKGAKKCTCPKCGHSFDEDNSTHVLQGAELAYVPFVQPDTSNSGQFSNSMFPSRSFK